MVQNNLSVKHLWIMLESGICLLEESFDVESKKKIDESLMGGLIAALFSFSKSISSGLDQLSMGSLSMYYASGNGVITCLALDKNVKAKIAQDITRKIHHEFLNSYQSVIDKNDPIESEIFDTFRKYVREQFESVNLLPKNYSYDKSRSQTLSQESNKVQKLVKNLISGEDPKKIAEELKATFVILRSGKEGKELRKILVDFDKFIEKLDIDSEHSKRLISLINEIRSYATIDEWLG